MRTFKYRWTEVEVDYNTYDNGDKEYYPEITLEAVYYLGVDILPIMKESEQIELIEEMNDKLFA